MRMVMIDGYRLSCVLECFKEGEKALSQVDWSWVLVGLKL